MDERTILETGAGRAAARPRSRHARHSPPGFVFPLLAAWEHFDRRRRHIRPIRRDGLLGIQLSRHRGAPILLADGTRIGAGTLFAEMHFDNRRLPAFYEAHGLGGVFAECRRELRDLAAWARRQPPMERPVAYHGDGLLAVGAVRVGWEERPRQRTWIVRLGDWYFRFLLARFAPGGVDRLERGRGPLRSRDVWCSHERLLRLTTAWAERDALSKPAEAVEAPETSDAAETSEAADDAAQRRVVAPASGRGAGPAGGRAVSSRAARDLPAGHRAAHRRAARAPAEPTLPLDDGRARSAREA